MSIRRPMMATTGFIVVIGFELGALALFIFARPLARWLRVHFG
jgi:hypothetical protein